MKTRLLILLTGLVIAQTVFGAVARRGGNEPVIKKMLSIALFRSSTLDRQYFLEIKTTLDEAGYSTRVITNPEYLKGDHIDLGIYLYAQSPVRDELYLEIGHNQNNLPAKCVGKALSRRTSLEYWINDFDYILFMQPGDPIVAIGVDANDIARHCNRYARGIVEGIEEYMEELE